MESWFPALRRWLSIELYQIRSSGVGFLLAAFFVMFIMFVATGREYDEISRRKTTPVIATITAFGMGGTKYHIGLISVTAQDDKGLTGTASVPPSMIRGCNIGDRIRAGRYGIALTLKPAPCPINVEPEDPQTLRAK